MKRYSLVGSVLLSVLLLGAWASMPAPGYPSLGERVTGFRAAVTHPDIGLTEAWRLSGSVVDVKADGRVYVDLGKGRVRTFWATEDDREAYNARFAAQTDTPHQAFPGAEGWGAKATVTCNRDSVAVLQVTNTSGSGDGSFAGEWDTAGTRPSNTLKVFVFRTAGWTTAGLGASSNLDCWYVAGQTAPGDGFGVHSGGRWLRLDGGTSTDGIMRGLVSAGNGVDGTTSVPLIGINDAKRLMWWEMMHLWAREKDLQLGTIADGDSVQDVTVGRSLFAQAQINEPTSTQISDLEDGSSPNDFVGRISWTRNLCHTISHRCPLVAISGGNGPGRIPDDEYFRGVGNLYYNSHNQGGAMFRSGILDWLDAEVVAGPMTADNVGTADYSWALSIELSSYADSALSSYGERLTGTHNTSAATGTDDLWHATLTCGTDPGNAEIAAYYRNECDPQGGGNPRTDLGTDIRRSSEIGALPAIPLTRIDPTTLQDSLVGSTDADATVGPYRRVQSDGTFATRTDSMLAEMLDEVRSGTGVNNPSNIDSSYVEARDLYPLASGTAPTDKDGDGLPDDREVLEGSASDSTDVAPGDDGDSDGYTSIEEYTNGSDPNVFDGEGGGGGGGTQLTCTFDEGGTCRQVIIVDATVDTLITSDTSGGRDTTVFRSLDRTNIPAGIQMCPVYKPDGDSAAVVMDSVASSGVDDSTTVDGTLTAWAVPESVSVIRGWAEDANGVVCGGS